ncbi:hypothetical protein MN116_005726 [Schistosoma mekongi]|uniref:Uncharacterized protein n=1 Tax=Schistosoma mekongi TaxID=38744 RepID=A0AAE1ZAF7_SCHME|nr:hypothetical protein MN116_005726 [Schistosoma mekongi]
MTIIMWCLHHSVEYQLYTTRMISSFIMIMKILLILIYFCRTNEISSCFKPQIHFNISGVIKSHAKYGILNYSPNLYCEYTIKAPYNYKINIQIEELDLEESNNCIFDYLLITDEYYTNMYTYCGQTRSPNPIEFNDSTVYIIFATDEASSGHGFILKYEMILKEELKPNSFYSCGLSLQINDIKDNIQSRILGGEITRRGQWPWMVSVRENGEFRCGASLIDTEWVLTAAHCFPKNLCLHNWKVHIGDFYLNWIDDEEISMNISSILIHPNYYLNKAYNYDYALIKTIMPIQYSTKRRPICLLNSSMLYNNQFDRCYVAGWGQSEDSPVSNQLNHLQIPLLNLTTCNQTEAYKGKLTETMICAGYTMGGKDSCQGDSGSPLMCQLLDNTTTTEKLWYQIGIVSFGKSCASLETPGIYSNVTFVNEWITSMIQLKK